MLSETVNERASRERREAGERARAALARREDERNAPVEVELDACEPPELLRRPMPPDLWLRLDAGVHWHVARIRGPRVGVTAFVRDNWGDDEVERLQEEGVL